MRITIGDDDSDFIDVAPEIASVLQRKGLVQFCQNCKVMHAHPKMTKSKLEEEVRLMFN